MKLIWKIIYLLFHIPYRCGQVIFFFLLFFVQPQYEENLVYHCFWKEIWKNKESKFDGANSTFAQGKLVIVM